MRKPQVSRRCSEPLPTFPCRPDSRRAVWLPCDELPYFAHLAEKNAVSDALYRIDRPPQFGPAYQIDVEDSFPRGLKLGLEVGRQLRSVLVESRGFAIPFSALAP